MSLHSSYRAGVDGTLCKIICRDPTIATMSKHLAKVAMKNDLLTGRNLKRIESGWVAICLDLLGLERERGKRTHRSTLQVPHRDVK